MCTTWKTENMPLLSAITDHSVPIFAVAFVATVALYWATKDFRSVAKLVGRSDRDEFMDAAKVARGTDDDQLDDKLEKMKSCTLRFMMLSASTPSDPDMVQHVHTLIAMWQVVGIHGVDILDSAALNRVLRLAKPHDCTRAMYNWTRNDVLPLHVWFSIHADQDSLAKFWDDEPKGLAGVYDGNIPHPHNVNDWCSFVSHMKFTWLGGDVESVRFFLALCLLKVHQELVAWIKDPAVPRNRAASFGALIVQSQTCMSYTDLMEFLILKAEESMRIDLFVLLASDIKYVMYPLEEMAKFSISSLKVIFFLIMRADPEDREFYLRQAMDTMANHDRAQRRLFTRNFDSDAARVMLRFLSVMNFEAEFSHVAIENEILRFDVVGAENELYSTRFTKGFDLKEFLVYHGCFHFFTIDANDPPSVFFCDNEKLMRPLVLWMALKHKVQFRNAKQMTDERNFSCRRIIFEHMKDESYLDFLAWLCEYTSLIDFIRKNAKNSEFMFELHDFGDGNGPTTYFAHIWYARPENYASVATFWEQVLCTNERRAALTAINAGSNKFLD